MNKALRLVVVALLTLGSASAAGLAQAQNEQTGDNESSTDQGGASNSGDAVGGQVVGVVSSGDSAIDATNRSEDVDIETGDATGTNDATNFTGQLADGNETNVAAPGDGNVADITGDISVNAQEGDNSSDVSQAADATSGDGVGGQVIGVVTSAGGSADVVAANTSEDVDVETGDADADNSLGTFVGQLADDNETNVVASGAGSTAVITGDVSLNAQDGDNSSNVSQAASATSGDGVGGQVLGIVSAGDASVDATNESTDVDITTGDADADNLLGSFTGQLAEGTETNIVAAVGGAIAGTTGDISFNTMQGDNSSDQVQDANAVSGDGVGGQVIGVVTSAGGSADVVAANTSEDVDIETGDADADNLLGSFTGQLADDTVTNVVAAGDTSIASIGAFSVNAQEGDNSSDVSQAANATSGDGVGGQVLGIVSAGEASVDATNTSEDVDVETGDADADNLLASFTGQLDDDATTNVVAADDGAVAGTGDISFNTMQGDNSSDHVQDANAVSGDGVGGQVIGVVTSAGGSADVVAANTSEDVDVETGDADADNLLGSFTGQLDDDTVINVVAGVAGSVAGITGDIFVNAQEGDNSSDVSQAANATSGDGVGGQVLGIVSAGEASVDATNTSEDVDIETGDADADNLLGSFTGQLADDTVINVIAAGAGAAAAIIGDISVNAQDGDNSSDLSQAANATSGDGVGGQIIGVVTSASGSADVVAANTSEDVDVETGDADADNSLGSFVGQIANDTATTVVAANTAGVASITGDIFVNAQEGDNSSDVSQAANATSGDGVGGQVLGIVSAGEASVDATNTSEDVDIETGDADADNLLGSFTGQLADDNDINVIAAVAEDVTAITGDVSFNSQDGDISSDQAQDANAVSGDAIGGQVAGVVTSAGGSADLVLANTSEDIDADSGSSEFDNDDFEFVGQLIEGEEEVLP